MTLISVGHNSKLGPGIASFNMPAGPSCPGATDLCATLCYAKGANMAFAANKAKYANNMTASLEPDFVDRIVREIKESGARTVRLHSSGDIMSPSYARKWVEIKKRVGSVEIYGYTRSWRLKRLMPALEGMREAGIVLYASIDDHTKETPPAGWPVAYMGEQDVGAIVCPNITSGGKKTCASCRWCIEGKGDVTFIPHGAGRDPLKRLLEITR